MLPSFPKSQRLLDDEWQKRMFAAKSKVFPPHIHPPVFAIKEGKGGDFQREDRKIKPLRIEHHEFNVQYSIKEGLGMTMEIFNQKADEAGQGMGKKMFETLTKGIEEAVAETGNQVAVKKGELKQEDMLPSGL